MTLFFSGTAHRAVLEAQSELARHWGVAATAFSITSYKRLREDALEAERTERLTGTERQRVWLDELMAQSSGPIVATTDYVRLVAEQVANFVDRPFLALGTDGFGRSDTREALRRFFEVDAAHVVVAAIAQLVRIGEAKPEELHDALAHYGVSPERFDPTM